MTIQKTIITVHLSGAMRLIVSSKSDPASQNIKEKMLSQGWDVIGRWKEEPVYRKGNDILATLERHHIYVDNVDSELRALVGESFDLVVYISKHASKAGIHSLTVHPIGNYGKAKFGGRDNVLVPPAPLEMNSAFHLLREEARKRGLDQDYEVSLEVTHHGPFLSTPTYYIEIGSDEDSWTDTSAGEAVASAVERQGEQRVKEMPVVVGVGGGHYAPHFTDMIKERDVSVGHIVPGWALNDLNEENLRMALEQSGTDMICPDPGGVKSSVADRLKRWSAEIGAEIVEPSMF